MHNSALVYSELEQPKLYKRYVRRGQIFIYVVFINCNFISKVVIYVKHVFAELIWR